MKKRPQHQSKWKWRNPQKRKPLPPNELGEPRKKFSETFSAVSLFEQRLPK